MTSSSSRSGENIEVGQSLSFPLSSFLRQKLLRARSVCGGTLRRGSRTCRRALENGRKAVVSAAGAAASSPSVEWVKKRVESVPYRTRRLWVAKVLRTRHDGDPRPGGVPEGGMPEEGVSRRNRRGSLSCIQEEEEEDEKGSFGGEGSSPRRCWDPTTRPKSFPVANAWTSRTRNFKGSSISAGFPVFRSPIVTKDRDVMKKELKKALKERDDALKRLTSPHQMDQSANYGTLNKQGGVVSEKALTSSREFESLKLRYEKSIMDVQLLKKQNMELSRKYEASSKDVEYYRKQERATYTSMQNLRLQYDEVLAEKQKLENEVTSLQTIMEEDRKEIADLRRQQQEAMTQEDSGEAINQLYITTLRKCEALKDEYDSFRKRYSDLAASHSNNISKLELAQEEITRLKKQYEEVVREKKCLKQQCTEAIMQWDTALRDKNRLQEEALKLREKNEELLKDMNTQVGESQNMSKEFKRLQSERNAAMQEYTLVMSERDTVHKEMDKLQEELNAASKRIKSIEQSTMESNKERETMQLQLETLKREVAASLHDRDKAIRECNELRERYGAEEDSNKDWENSYKDYDTYKQERELKLKEASDLAMTASHDLYVKAQKERLENLDQANQEIDRLRKTVEKLQSDLEEAKREAEVSKGRRDWAFSERDKIVLERESIRAHCDKLRHERDRAVSELAEALRDSDDMMKQRNEASKELKELREKLEAMQEKSVSVRHVIGHNNSRDSAIDTDMQEWEHETLQLQIGLLSERDLGLEISGGSEDLHYGSSDGAVYVASIAKDSPFEGKLRLHDQLIRINGFECQGANLSSINNAVLKCGGWVQVTVRRRRSGSRTLHTTQIHCRNPSHHGLILQTGVYIANILPGSPAAREGHLAVGDRLLNVNGKPIESSASCNEAQALLDSGGEVIQLTTLKSVGGSSSLSAPLSSSSSGHNMTEDDKALLSTSPCKDAYSFPLGRGNRDLGFKLTRGGEERRVGSSERVVYNVTKPVEEKGSTGGPWGQFKNIVKPRRHSKERGDGRSESREKEDKRKIGVNRGVGIPSFDQEKENAIAELDSVLDSYRYASSSSSSSGTSKRSKKKEKSGGTWPKYRGGIITLNDINMGTIKAPVPARKERPPLSMYLTSVSSENNQTSTGSKTYANPYDLDEKHHKNSSSIQRGNNCGLRANLTNNNVNNPRSAHMFSVFKSIENADLTAPYKISEHYGSPNYASQPTGQQIYSNLSNRVGVGASVSDRKEESDKEHQEQQQHHSSPDTSLDFSVRSGNVGKEELEYYVKKNWVKYPHSETDGGPLHHQPSSLPPVYMSRPSPLHHLGERLPPTSRIPHSHSGLYSPTSGALRASPAFAPYSTLSFHPHSHPHTVSSGVNSYSSPSYSSPPPLPMLGGSPNFLSPSRSGDSILSSPGPDRDPRDIRNYYENQISSSPTFWLNISSGSGLGGFYHSASPSVDTGGGLKRAIHPHHPHGLRVAQEEPPGLTHSHVGPPSYHDYQRTVSTIPRKRDEERLRIPSSTGIVTNKGVRNGLMERGFERGEQNPERESPMPGAYPVTQISHSINNPHMLHKKAQPGDLRSIYIEKEKEPLGIQIRCLESGGVYVSSVTPNSLAEQVGLCIGDQLLEVCGINMRSANKTVASTVLSQCGNSVTMLVQYNPDKYHEAESWDESSSGGSMIIGSRSGTPTPQNSPKAARSSPIGGKDEEDEEEEEEDLPPSSSSTLRAPLDPRDSLEHSLPPSARSTLTRPQATHLLNMLKRQDTFTSTKSDGGGSPSESKGGNSSGKKCEPRMVYIEMNKCHNLGIQMVGGNALGIFIHSIRPDSPAAKSDLRVGDRILEFNEVDLRHATAEQAACELSKPSDNVNILVQWDYQTYSEIKDQPGDCFYVRALFTKSERNDSSELCFQKDDILYVDNTLFNSMLGQWRAWLVNEDGDKRSCGTIPSKDKVEEEILSQRNMGELPMDSSRRGSTGARRSFFRRKKHSRSSSRDSKELASFSDASLSAYAEATPVPDEPVPLAYVRVERLDYLIRRPLIMVGPLWEVVCEKLIHDFPHTFTKCIPEIKHFSQADLEGGVQNGTVVDYRRRGNHYEVTFMSQVKAICDKSCHGILDVSLSSVERMHRHNIYPIVLVLKFKHHKHIRDISDATLSTHERLSQKEAKEMFEINQKIDQEYKHLVSAEITAGVNMAYILAQVKSLVDTEQSKTLWVPAGGL